MSRYIDADALLDTVFEVHCKECESRKGIKNGKLKVIYEVGEAPCKSCGVNDMREYLEDAPTADVVEVVRCKDCKWQDKGKNECESWNMCRHNVIEYFAIYDEHFCEWGERREDD